MSDSDIRYCIILRSKYTGESIHLGSQYETREEAQKAIDKEVCSRCNYADIRMIRKDKIWENRHQGFVNRKNNVVDV